MRVLFIIPGYPRKSEPSPDGMPLGVLYLASIIRSDHDVRIIDDYSFPGEKDIDSVIDSFEPQIIAISIPFKFLENSAKELSLRIRKKYEIPCVAGGIHATLAFDRIERESAFDLIIPGEAENTFRDFIFQVESSGDFSAKYISSFKGKFNIESKPDIDKIPFPSRDLLEFRDRYFERILTSRGCGFSCAFCSSRKFWGDFRGRNVENIIEELELIYSERGAVLVSFADDSFTYDQKRVIDFCDAIESSGIKTYGLGFSSHPNRLNEQILHRMRRAGFDSIFLGLESGSDRVLRKIGKVYNRQNTEELIRYATASGFDVHVSFMIGLPGESKEDIEKTIGWAEQIQSSSIGFHIFYPFEGCEIRENPEKFGIKIHENPLNEGDINGEAVIHNGLLSPREILDYYYRARSIAKKKMKRD